MCGKFVSQNISLYFLLISYRHPTLDNNLGPQEDPSTLHSKGSFETKSRFDLFPTNYKYQDSVKSV